MYKKLKAIREDQQQKKPASTNPPMLKSLQKNKSQLDRQASKKVDASNPKNNDAVFSAKPEPDRGAGDDRHPSIPKPKTVRPTMESIMSVGSGAVAGITDPTTNYAFQVQKKKFKKLAQPAIERRKKPVAEEFEAGLGNTQINPGTKSSDKKSSLKDIKVRSKKKISAEPPIVTSVNADTGPAMGGE